MHRRRSARQTHFWLRLLLRPGRPPPKGLFSAKSMCFWLSTRTMNDGTFTICLPTLRKQHHRVRIPCMQRSSKSAAVCNTKGSSSTMLNHSAKR